MARAGRLAWVVLATVVTPWGCGSSDSGASNPDGKAPAADGPPGNDAAIDGAVDGPIGAADAPDGARPPALEAGAEAPAAAAVRKTPTSGSAIAITADDRWA